MEIKGILSKKLNSRNGVSAKTGEPWQTDEWLLYIPGRYERHVCLEVRGTDRCKEWDEFFTKMPENMKNTPVSVDFEIDAREWEGRWFNTIQAWRISMAQGW